MKQRGRSEKQPRSGVPSLAVTGELTTGAVFRTGEAVPQQSSLSQGLYILTKGVAVARITHNFGSTPRAKIGHCCTPLG